MVSIIIILQLVNLFYIYYVHSMLRYFFLNKISTLTSLVI